MFYKKNWVLTLAIMMVTMLIDFDHLLATPIYDMGRCSVGFHPLHTLVPISVYVALYFFPKTRVISIGLMIHLLLDSIDCQLISNVWFVE